MPVNSNISSDQAEYYRLIDECAQTKKDLLISNGLAEHAVYLMTLMFRHAQSHIRLFSGELPDVMGREHKEIKIYSNDELMAAAENFLRNECSNLDILVQKAENVKSRIFIRDLERKKQGGLIKGLVKLKVTNASISDISSHFMIVDNSGYRLETDHDNTKAIANFGDNKTARRLVDIFNVLFNNASEICTI